MTVEVTTTRTRREGGAASAVAPFWARRGVRLVGGLILPLILLAAWQVVTTTGIIPPYRLPTPASVVQAGVQLAADGDLWLHIAISTQRVIVGFLIGSVLGLAVAAVVGLSRAGEVLLGPTIVALRAGRRRRAGRGGEAALPAGE